MQKYEVEEDFDEKLFVEEVFFLLAAFSLANQQYISFLICNTRNLYKALGSFIVVCVCVCVCVCMGVRLRWLGGCGMKMSAIMVDRRQKI